MDVAHSFQQFNRELGLKLVNESSVVETEQWQSVEMEKGEPRKITHELTNVSFAYRIPRTLAQLRADVEPNLPWADYHFLERVSRKPLNPGEQYKNWPYYYHDPHQESTFRAGGKFSHTYMERFWPPAIMGIRYTYGSLDHVIDLLLKDPHTRQAYFPIWFPEDTGTAHGERVPCSLGYHFLMRDNQLNITYFIRSCDYLRHFQDDVYLACRLLMWVLGELRGEGPKDWDMVGPGNLIMHITSLHVFEGELYKLKGDKRGQR